MQSSIEESVETPIATSAPVRFIEPNGHFRPDFNRLPFQFFHRLTNHPLFALPRLLELAQATRQERPRDLYYDAGPDIRPDQRWDQMGPKPFVVEEALHRIETCGAWVTLHQAQKDPEYGALFYECMREFEGLTGVDFKKVMRVEDALIFITSPRRVTPYHIDRECNFLLQIRGEKNLYVFDRNDRDVLPVTEVERFWAVDNNAAVYKPQFQSRATTYRLVPGNGVHIPVNNPHWVQNDDNVSISLSVNFTWNDWERANVHRANFLLRKLGISPRPPKQSTLVDAAKNALISTTYMPAFYMARGSVRFLRRLRGDRGDGFRPKDKAATA
jgi:hypothetical protein